MLQNGGRVLRLDIGHGVRGAFVADQQAVALREVADVLRFLVHRDETAIGVGRPAGGNALGDDPARRVLAEMDHLGAAIHLLLRVGNGDGIELAARIVAAQDATGIFPGDGGARLHLRPGNLRVLAPAVAALRHEVVDAALAVLVAGIPVLNGGVFDLRIVHRHQFHHGGMKLVLVALRRGAAFEIAYIRAFFRNDERAFELARLLLVDTEIGRQLHRAAHALGDVDERPVGEDGGVERRKEIVRHRNDAAEIFLHQIRIVADGLRNRAEDDARLFQLFLEGGDDRHAVENGIHRDARQHLLLLERNAELLIGFEKLGVHLVEAFGPGGLLGRGIIVSVLIVHRRIEHLGPCRLFHVLPAAERFQTPFQHPFRFVLFRGDVANGILRQADRRLFGFDLGREAVFVLLHFANGFDCLLDGRHFNSPLPRAPRCARSSHFRPSRAASSPSYRRATSFRRTGSHHPRCCSSPG